MNVTVKLNDGSLIYPSYEPEHLTKLVDFYQTEYSTGSIVAYKIVNNTGSIVAYGGQF